MCYRAEKTGKSHIPYYNTKLYISVFNMTLLFCLQDDATVEVPKCSKSVRETYKWTNHRRTLADGFHDAGLNGIIHMATDEPPLSYRDIRQGSTSLIPKVETGQAR